MSAIEGLPVAVDAMGGDNAPVDVVEGALIASEKFDVPVILVGDPEKISDHADLEIIPASEVIPMGADAAGAVRTMKDSSIVRAAEAVRDGKASCLLSAGNTGAAMAASLLRLGRIKGISRPAIAIPYPVLGSTPTTLLDVGANAQCQPEWLVQFGLMGVGYCRARWNIEVPRIGILTIGEEAGKGNNLVKDASKLLEEINWQNFNAEYVGNLEGGDLLTGAADVVVCDGFTGNIVLKTSEGIYNMFDSFIKAELSKTSSADEALAAITPTFEYLDPVGVGTGMLLGVKGVSMIAHGSSSPTAIANAISNAYKLSQMDLVDKIKSSMSV